MTTDTNTPQIFPNRVKIDTVPRSKDENLFLNFDTGGKLIVKLSNKSKGYLRSLRKMCIEYSPDNIPEKREASSRKPDYLEEFLDIRDMVSVCFESLIQDDCLPFVALKLIHRTVHHNQRTFLSMFAIKRILGMEDMQNTEKNSDKFIKNDEYKFQDVSKYLSSLQTVATSLERRIDQQIFLAGFCRHSTKDMNLAIYSDDLTNDPLFKDKPPWEVLETIRNNITGEIKKELVESLFEKSNNLPPDYSIMEIDSLSMLHFVKRLLLLHREDPLKTRKIYYSRSRKKIIKIV